VADPECRFAMPQRASGANALIARIGEDGAPFNPFKTTGTGTGMLYLRLNDCDKYLSDNVGRVTVRIQIVAIPPPPVIATARPPLDAIVRPQPGVPRPPPAIALERPPVTARPIPDTSVRERELAPPPPPPPPPPRAEADRALGSNFGQPTLAERQRLAEVARRPQVAEPPQVIAAPPAPAAPPPTAEPPRTPSAPDGIGSFGTSGSGGGPPPPRIAPPAVERAAPPRAARAAPPSSAALPQIAAGAAPPDAGQLADELASQLAKGNVVFNPPSQMRMGRNETVTVRISRESVLPAEALSGLPGRGAAQTAEILTGAFMRVELFADNGFEIKARGTADQAVPPSGFAEWLFDVLPVSGGQRTLTLRVAARYKLPSGEEIRYLPVLTRDIAVEVDYWWQTRQLVSNNWQYFLSGWSVVLLGVGGYFGKRFIERDDKKDDRPRRKRARA